MWSNGHNGCATIKFNSKVVLYTDVLYTDVLHTDGSKVMDGYATFSYWKYVYTVSKCTQTLMDAAVKHFQVVT